MLSLYNYNFHSHNIRIFFNISKISLKNFYNIKFLFSYILYRNWNKKQKVEFLFFFCIYLVYRISKKGYYFYWDVGSYKNKHRTTAVAIFVLYWKRCPVFWFRPFWIIIVLYVYVVQSTGCILSAYCFCGILTSYTCALK